jgi:hypothetical protein
LTVVKACEFVWTQILRVPCLTSYQRIRKSERGEVYLHVCFIKEGTR